MVPRARGDRTSRGAWWRNRARAACWACAAAAIVLAAGAQAAEPALLNEEELSARLPLPISINWRLVPLRQALASLGAAQRMAIVRDRRVDPEPLLNLAIDGLPLEQALARIAAARKLGVSVLGPVVYFGPAEDADKLRTLAALARDQAERLPPAARQKLLHRAALDWPELSTPRELLVRLGREAGVKFAGGQQIPHDLWPASQWPPLAWTDRLTLLLVQFGLAPELDDAGRTVRFVPLPADPSLVRTYDGGAYARAQSDAWRQRWPSADLRVEGKQIAVRARAEIHDQIAAQRSRRSAPGRPAAPAGGKEVFTLSVKDIRLGELLRQFGPRLDLEFTYDQAALEAAGVSLDRRVSLAVKEASLDELLGAAVHPAGLSFRRSGRKVTIEPAAKGER